MAVPYPQRLQIPQMPNSALEGKLVTINSSYIDDVQTAINEWNCCRVMIVASFTTDQNTDKIERLVTALGSKYVGRTIGNSGEMRISEILTIATKANEWQADTIISVGSHTDAAKIARLLSTTYTLPELNEETMNCFTDPKLGASWPKMLKAPSMRLIAIPRSLSISEYNPISCAMKRDGTKVNFGTESFIPALPDLILLDPEMALTVPPEHTFLPSGARAIDHAIETICCRVCEEEGRRRAVNGLRALVRGLRTYKEQLDIARCRQAGYYSNLTYHSQRAQANKGQSSVQHTPATSSHRILLSAISCCQQGTRDAIAGVIAYKSVCGPSHAICYQFAEHTSLPLAVASSIILPAVLKYERYVDPVGRMWNVDGQRTVVAIFNEVMGWKESDASTTIEKFFKTLNLPTTLSEVGFWNKREQDKTASVVDEEDVLEKIARLTADQAEWMGGPAQIEDAKAIFTILDSVR